MQPVGDPCPSVAQIERFACGEPTDAAVAAHVDACRSCRDRVRAARDDSFFLMRARTLAGSDLGPDGAPRLTGYRTLSILSEGAQGIVYRARQESTSRTVAIKVIRSGPSASSHQRLRAEREAEIAARLRHPNIVTVFESRTLSDGRIAVVMEFIAGLRFDQWAPPGRDHSEREGATLRVFIAVCNAIHHAHLNGVIHRDLKPDNILVDTESRPVILDFGIAKTDGINATLTGEFAGTPAYASPEQASGKPDEVDALTDVYSLGVILYRLICGGLPYKLEGSIFEIAQTIAKADPIPPRRANPAVSPDLEAIILRALRKEKDRRYHSAADLARDVERYLEGRPVEARSGSGWYLLRKAMFVNRRRLAWAASLAALAFVTAAAVSLSALRASRAAREAASQHEKARLEGIRARAVTELLREALPQTPSQAGYVTVGSDLGRLYFRLESGAFRDDPEVDQALRRLWGSAYTSFGARRTAGLVAYAEVSLRAGLTRLRLEHGEAHPEIAASMHELAALLLVRNRAPEAEAICRDALAMRRRLLGDRSFEAAESTALLATILIARGDHAVAEQHAEQARGMLGAFPDTRSDVPIAAMNALLGRIQLDSNKFPEAAALTRDALIRRLRRVPPEEPEVLESLADAAHLASIAPDTKLARDLFPVWHASPDNIEHLIEEDCRLISIVAPPTQQHPSVKGRTEALGRLVTLAERLLGPNDPALVGILLTQVRASYGEDAFAVRADAALRAASIIEATFGPDDPSTLVCLDDAALALVFDGRSDEAANVAARACRIRDAIPSHARDAILVGNGWRNRGWFLVMAGRYAEGEVAYTRAIKEFTAAVGPRHHVIALSEAGLAYADAETGRLESADRRSAAALALARDMPATPQDTMCHILFVRGHVLTAIGRYEEARQVLEQVWGSYYGLGLHRLPWRDICIRDMIACVEALGDAASAEAWRAR